MKSPNKTRPRLNTIKNIAENISSQINFLKDSKPNFHKSSFETLQEIHDILIETAHTIEQFGIDGSINKSCEQPNLLDISRRLDVLETISVENTQHKPDGAPNTQPLPIIPPLSIETNMDAIIETLNNIEDYVVRTYRVCKKLESKEKDKKSDIEKILVDTIIDALKNMTVSYSEQRYTTHKKEHTTITTYK